MLIWPRQAAQVQTGAWPSFSATSAQVQPFFFFMALILSPRAVLASFKLLSP